MDLTCSLSIAPLYEEIPFGGHGRRDTPRDRLSCLQPI
jgi:hypothetical protein